MNLIDPIACRCLLHGIVLGALIDPSSSATHAPPSVDAAQPTTLLQVKLADGKKIKVKYVMYIVYICIHFIYFLTHAQTAK